MRCMIERLAAHVQSRLSPDLVQISGTKGTSHPASKTKMTTQSALFICVINRSCRCQAIGRFGPAVEAEA